MKKSLTVASLIIIVSKVFDTRGKFATGAVDTGGAP
jgi:hypothetical protein